MDTTTIRLVGLAEISDLLGVKPETPRMWRQRGVLPPALQELAVGPVWLEDDIIGWARDTGRLPNDRDETRRPSRVRALGDPEPTLPHHQPTQT